MAEPAARLEYEVKAAFLFNFARFVEWPDVRGVGDRTFTIGILGSDPFGEILDRAVAGKKFNGQTIAVRRLREPKDATACRILFIGTSEDRRFLEIMETLRGAPVLTVTEMTTGKRGAVIRFFIEDRGVRFEVDLDAAARSGLKISSRLLSVARVLRDPVAGGR
ncbi:MAG: YfiR family protein [Acidobacteriia bacterium]|nr:YfiR family protein [Terriglobia bacterium]